MSYSADAMAFTALKRDALRRAYEMALSQGRTEFVFEERDYLTAYARYLLEYLDAQLGNS